MAAFVLRRMKFFPSYADGNENGNENGNGGGIPNRARTVAAVQEALARRGQRRAFQKKVLRVSLLSAAAAVLLASAWVLTRDHRAGQVAQGTEGYPAGALTILGDDTGNGSPGGAALTGHGSPSLPAASGMTLQLGTVVVAPLATEIRIGNGDGTVLTLEKAGEMIVGEQTRVRRYSLTYGAVRAHVAKLRPGQRFIVSTEDAEVEVHGTVFRVAIVPANSACEGGIRTRVSVTEGVVSVRAKGSEAFVPAGAVWPRTCPAEKLAVRDEGVVPPGAAPAAERPRSPRLPHQAAQTLAARRSGKVALASAPAAATARSEAPAAASAPEASSPLAGQNDLFAAAIRAKRQGRAGESVRLFSQLVETYPDGPLTEGAMVQRMRVLATSDGGAARRAAAEYLQRFPGGFASGEARRLAGASP